MFLDDPEEQVAKFVVAVVDRHSPPEPQCLSYIGFSKGQFVVAVNENEVEGRQQ